LLRRQEIPDLWFDRVGRWSPAAPPHTGRDPDQTPDPRGTPAGAPATSTAPRLRPAAPAGFLPVGSLGPEELPASRTYYDRKRAEGKTHTQTMLSLARRRLNLLWAVLRDGTTYIGVPAGGLYGHLTTRACGAPLVPNRSSTEPSPGVSG